jgi:hypothetical protein
MLKAIIPMVTTDVFVRFKNYALIKGDCGELVEFISRLSEI